VILGSFYGPEYFDFIADSAIREPLKQIAQEINKDLDYFADILREHGAQVLRPPLVSVDDFETHFLQHGSFPTPPLQPRNYHTVIGNRIYQLEHASEADLINTVLPETATDLTQVNHEFFQAQCEANQHCYNADHGVWYSRKKYLELAGPDWPSFESYVQGHRGSLPSIQAELETFGNVLAYETKEWGPIQAPNIFPVGNRLYVDAPEYFDYVSWTQKHIEFDRPVIQINTGAGHTDGCFVVLGQKVIIGVVPGIDYEQAFPGYRVVASSASYADAVQRRVTQGGYFNRSWWVPGQEHNQSLINYVDRYMQDWTGTAYETSFDLNVLALDEQTVCMIVGDPEIVKQLNAFGIRVIEIPWRHRFFVDCGLHCLTLDLDRE
jgi:hypothetical protein